MRETVSGRSCEAKSERSSTTDPLMMREARRPDGRKRELEMRLATLREG